MSDLPSGWVEEPIGEICRVVGGSTPSTKVPTYWGGDIAWLTPDDLARDRSQRIRAGRRSITKAGYDSCSTQMLPPGTVLFTSRAPIGYVAIAAQSLCTNQGFKSFVPGPGVDSDYLYWYLRSATPMIRDMGSGTTFAEISGRVARTVPLRLAPTAEQERIVAAIEEHLSRLDAAEAALSEGVRRAEILRQRTIDAFLTGPPIRLGGVLREPLRNGFSAKRSSDGSVRVLTLTAVTQGQFTEENTKRIQADAHRIRDLWLMPGDIFVQRSNTPQLVGTARLYEGPERWAIFPDLLIRARLNGNADPRYVELALQSLQLRTYFQRAAQGIAGSMPKISQTTIEQARIPLPSVEEQRAAVSRIRTALDTTDRLLTSARIVLRRTARLRSAILAAAFAGRLVPQQPNDEPVSVLLERVRAERAAARPKRRRKGAA